jgi:hypothetical protein
VYFAMAALKETRRHKCHYAVAVTTILLIVLSTLVVQTLVERGPVIFLNLS